jgi:hypothetical protein
MKKFVIRVSTTRYLVAAGNGARLDEGRRMNQISVIEPYLLAGTWVFDDQRVGLQAEPFVAGVPEIIDRVLCESGLEHAERFRLTFSGEPFPGCRQLSRREAEFGGTWYQDVNSGLIGWLCPALFRYFAAAPPKVFFKVDPSGTTPARHNQLVC